jgi:hypothetical protein
MSAVETGRPGKLIAPKGGSLQITLPVVRDQRGVVVFGQVGNELPFTPVRFFTISGVPPTERRAEHAHHALEEVLVSLKGACTVTLDDGRTREDFRLDRPDIAVYKPPMMWVIVHSFSPDALILCLASDVWKEEDHIKDYETFRKLAEAARK